MAATTSSTPSRWVALVLRMGGSEAGGLDEHGRQRKVGNGDFILTGANRLDDDRVETGGIKDVRNRQGLGGEAAPGAARGHAADEDVGVGVPARHPDPVAEGGATGERAGGVDSDDRDPVSPCSVQANQFVDEGGLPCAGRASDAN